MTSSRGNIRMQIMRKRLTARLLQFGHACEYPGRPFRLGWFAMWLSWIAPINITFLLKCFRPAFLNTYWPSLKALGTFYDFNNTRNNTCKQILRLFSAFKCQSRHLECNNIPRRRFGTIAWRVSTVVKLKSHASRPLLRSASFRRSSLL